MDTLRCSILFYHIFSHNVLISLVHFSFGQINRPMRFWDIGVQSPFCSVHTALLLLSLHFVSSSLTDRQTQTTQTSSPSSSAPSPSAPSPAPAPSLRRWKVFAVTLFLYGSSCNSLWSKVERRVPMQTSAAPITLLSLLEDKKVETKRVTSCLTEWSQRLRGSHMTTQEMEKQTSVGTLVWVCQRNSTLLVFLFYLFFFSEYLSVVQGFLVLHRRWKRWFISRFTKSNGWSIQKK